MKQFVLFLVFLFLIVTSCGPSPEEVQARRKADSLQHLSDSLFHEKVVKLQDSIKNAWLNSAIHKEHPEWSLEDCKRIERGEIWIGMSLYMVIHMRGWPDSENVSNYGSGNEYQWCWHSYTPSCFYGKSNRIITSYN